MHSYRGDLEMRRIIFLLIGFVPLLLNGATLSREDVISRAAEYANHTWVVNKTNPNFKIYQVSGVVITGEAYSFGDKATTSLFDKEIADGKIPRNWEKNFNESTQALYTGIDCSGLVTRSLNFSYYLVHYTNAAALAGYTIPVIEECKEGDVWWSSGHVFLQGPGKSVFESNPKDKPGGGQRVQNWKGDTIGYTARSVFPQFDDESPADGEVVDLPEGETTVDIFLTLKASGDINSTGVRMYILKDGGVKEYIGGTTLDDKGDKTWEFKKEDFEVGEGGNFTVYITARNDIAGNGYKDEYEWQFSVDPAPPVVRATDPSDAAREVPVDKSPITITFSEPMNQTTTTPAVQVPFACSKNWSSETVLEIIPDDTLDYCEKYTIIVSDAATDTSGVHLDGNKDGKPGGVYPFTFTIEQPPIALNIEPECENVGEGKTIKPKLITNGSKLKKEFDCNVDFNPYNPGGWSVTGISEPSFSLLPRKVHTDNFTVSNTGATAPLRVTSRIPIKCGIIYSEGYYWTSEEHKNDHPDENQSPGESQYPTSWITRTQSVPSMSTKLRADSALPKGLPDVGILLSGWADGYGHILGKYGIETLPVKPDLKIINHPDVDISDSVKLLVIGSAGLKGFISQEFKQKLEEYERIWGQVLFFEFSNIVYNL
jgi:hypothetical protein